MPGEPVFKIITMSFPVGPHHFTQHELLAKATSSAVRLGGTAKCFSTPSHFKEGRTTLSQNLTLVSKGARQSQMWDHLWKTPQDFLILCLIAGPSFPLAKKTQPRTVKQSV